MLNTIFLDLDDTLCDTIGVRLPRARKALEVVCRAYPELDLEVLVARSLEALDEPRSVRGPRAVLEEQVLAETPAAAEAMQLYLGWHEPVAFFPDVEQVLAELSQTYQLGVITNAEEWYQLTKVSHLGLERYVRQVVISGAVGHAKPDRRIFQHALDLAGVRPEEAVMVGDRLDVDVAGAKAVGMRAIWFNHWGGAATPELPRPDAEITRFAELPRAIGRPGGAVR